MGCFHGALASVARGVCLQCRYAARIQGALFPGVRASPHAWLSSDAANAAMNDNAAKA